ncbi:hypothetical protein MJG53_006544 [Ovis ammon polii x Ovis aries]|uniref:Uncharacterized protein n=1 Tax=Ovis ammon polii x Ovis aries TaxID=2918886 RepID=A0ACB9V6C2_9CETA|nr:hypothetical protein MJG53_006544 [Ovis ammon polii x Ovis aries]
MHTVDPQCDVGNGVEWGWGRECDYKQRLFSPKKRSEKTGLKPVRGKCQSWKVWFHEKKETEVVEKHTLEKTVEEWTIVLERNVFAHMAFLDFALDNCAVVIHHAGGCMDVPGVCQARRKDSQGCKCMASYIFPGMTDKNADNRALYFPPGHFKCPDLPPHKANRQAAIVEFQLGWGTAKKEEEEDKEKDKEKKEEDEETKEKEETSKKLIFFSKQKMEVSNAHKIYHFQLTFIVSSAIELGGGNEKLRQ